MCLKAWKCIKKQSEAQSKQTERVNLELSVHTYTVATVSRLHSGFKCTSTGDPREKEHDTDNVVPEVQLTCFCLHWWPHNSQRTAHWHSTIRGHVTYLTCLPLPPRSPRSPGAKCFYHSSQMPLATALVVWQPQVWFRFMPCQIARIPASHSLLAGKGQLSLSWASLNFAVFVGTRWFGCYNTSEELYENMTAPKIGAVHHVWFSSFFISRIFVGPCKCAQFWASWHPRFSLFDSFFLSRLRPLFSLRLSLSVGQLQASTGEGLSGKWSVRSVFQGVSLTRLCALSRVTTVCESFGPSGTNEACWCFFMIHDVTWRPRLKAVARPFI